MSTTLDISPADVRDAIDFLEELRALSRWKKDSHIPHYDKEYNDLSGLISRMDAALQRSLTFVVDIQKIYSGGECCPSDTFTCPSCLGVFVINRSHSCAGAPPR